MLISILKYKFLKITTFPSTIEEQHNQKIVELKQKLEKLIEKVTPMIDELATVVN